MDGRELKLFNERTMEAQFLRHENQFLRRDRDWLRVEMYHADQRFAELEEECRRAEAENRLLQRRVEELTRKVLASAAPDTPSPPAFVKANVPKRRRKRPGRKAGHACRLETRPDRLLAIRYEEANERRIATRMRRHRHELTAFLWDRNLDGTNNAAERALRPAVVARKISGGSRSKKGADAWAKLASLMRTAEQQGRNVQAVVKQLLIEHWSGQPAMALLAGP